MAAEHNGEFGPRRGVLALHSVRVEDDSQCAFGVLFKRDALRDEVAETGGVEVGFGVIEVDCHDSYEGG